MTSTLASASSSAAVSSGRSSNCPSAASDREISVTRKRLKWAETVSKSCKIAVVTGSNTVLDDGVSIPNKTRFSADMALENPVDINLLRFVNGSDGIRFHDQGRAIAIEGGAKGALHPQPLVSFIAVGSVSGDRQPQWHGIG